MTPLPPILPSRRPQPPSSRERFNPQTTRPQIPTLPGGSISPYVPMDATIPPPLPPASSESQTNEMCQLRFSELTGQCTTEMENLIQQNGNNAGLLGRKIKDYIDRATEIESQMTFGLHKSLVENLKNTTIRLFKKAINNPSYFMFPRQNPTQNFGARSAALNGLSMGNGGPGNAAAAPGPLGNWNRVATHNPANLSFASPPPLLATFQFPPDPPSPFSSQISASSSSAPSRSATSTPNPIPRPNWVSLSAPLNSSSESGGQGTGILDPDPVADGNRVATHNPANLSFASPPPRLATFHFPPDPATELFITSPLDLQTFEALPSSSSSSSTSSTLSGTKRKNTHLTSSSKKKPKSKKVKFTEVITFIKEKSNSILEKESVLKIGVSLFKLKRKVMKKKDELEAKEQEKIDSEWEEAEKKIRARMASQKFVKLTDLDEAQEESDNLIEKFEQITKYKKPRRYLYEARVLLRQMPPDKIKPLQAAYQKAVKALENLKPRPHQEEATGGPELVSDPNGDSVTPSMDFPLEDPWFSEPIEHDSSFLSLRNLLSPGPESNLMNPQDQDP